MTLSALKLVSPRSVTTRCQLFLPLLQMEVTRDTGNSVKRQSKKWHWAALLNGNSDAKSWEGTGTSVTAEPGQLDGLKDLGRDQSSGCWPAFLSLQWCWQLTLRRKLSHWSTQKVKMKHKLKWFAGRGAVWGISLSLKQLSDPGWGGMIWRRLISQAVIINWSSSFLSMESGLMGIVYLPEVKL